MTSSPLSFGYAPPLAHQAPTKPPQIGTIGDVIRQQLSMTIYCERRGCGHCADVDLEGIQAKYGDDFRVSGFVARSKCGKCGARHPEVAIRVSPSYAPRVITHHRSK
jgi:hypothetical protein